MEDKIQIRCEQHDLTITCPSNHHIVINSTSCMTNYFMVAEVWPDEYCSSTNSSRIVNDLCTVKERCTISPRNDVFGGDPCSGTSNYVEVTYSCKVGMEIPGNAENPTDFGIIIGIIAAVLVAVLLLIAVLCWCRCKRKKDKENTVKNANRPEGDLNQQENGELQHLNAGDIPQNIAMVDLSSKTEAEENLQQQHEDA